jgi:hypothetical protein
MVGVEGHGLPDLLSQNLTSTSVALLTLAFRIEFADGKWNADTLVGEEISAIAVECARTIVLARVALLEPDADGEAFDALARGSLRIAGAHAVPLPARHRTTVLHAALVVLGLDIAGPQAIAECVVDRTARDDDTGSECCHR